MSEKYFCLLPAKELGGKIPEMVDEYKQNVKTLGLLDIWEDSYHQYFRGYYTRGQIEFHGKQNEFRTVSYNHYRNFLQHIYTLITAQKPAFEPQAVNPDFKSSSQIQIARNLLDYYVDVKGLDGYAKTAAEYAIFLGEGYLIDEWDPTIGDVVLSDEKKKGKDIYAGDIVYENASPLDVARDLGVRHYRDLEWVIVTTYRNKYSLAAKYPEIKEKIENYDYKPQADDLYLHERARLETDYVPIHTLYHKKSPAMPNGRIVRVVDNIVLFDSPIPYANFPVKRIAPNEIHFLPIGYSVGFDLLQLQRIKDMLESTIATNQDMFGVQNITVPVGSNLSPEVFLDGLNVIYYDPDRGKVEPMNLVQTPREIFENKQSVVQEMEVLSAVNSVMRGAPTSNIRSGNQAALIQAMGTQFNSQYERSYTSFLEDVANSLIDMFKEFADSPRIIDIAGKSEKFYMKEFKGEDVSQIKRIVVKTVDPLLKTMTGRQAVADSMLERNLLRTPEQYLQMRESGRLEPLAQREGKEMGLIQQENEQIQSGEQPPVVDIDMHVLHINEHAINTSSPEARTNPEVVQANLQHIMEHIQALATANPALLQVLGQPSLQAPPPPPQGEQGPPPPGGVSNDTTGTPPPEMAQA